MKKMVLAALIAATALAPFSAVAQEWQGRRGGGRDGGGQARGQRAERLAAPAGSGGGEAFRGRPAGAAVDRDAFRAQRQAARAQGGDSGQTVDRSAFRSPRDNARAPGAGEQRVDREAWRGQRRADRPDRPVGAVTPQPVAEPQQGRRDWSRGDTAARGDRREDRRDVADRRTPSDRYQTDRFDGRRNDRDGRRDDRRTDGRRDLRNDWSRDSAWRGDRGGSWNRGNDRWNRDWRSDRRYDWQDWRGRNRSAYRLPRYYAPRGYTYGYQRFGIGFTLGSILFSQNYWINDPWQYRLPPAYGPFRWVRYYNDALLVDIDTGEVVDVIHDIFW